MQKNKAFSSFCSRDIVNLKILQFDWLRAFWPISKESDFSQVWDLCKNTANIIKFLYKKTLFLAHFGSIFPIFGAKKNFLENPALSPTTSYGFLAPCQNLEKINDIIQRKCPERQKDGRTEGWTEGQTDPIL